MVAMTGTEVCPDERSLATVRLSSSSGYVLVITNDHVPWTPDTCPRALPTPRPTRPSPASQARPERLTQPRWHDDEGFVHEFDSGQFTPYALSAIGDDLLHETYIVPQRYIADAGFPASGIAITNC